MKFPLKVYAGRLHVVMLRDSTGNNVAQVFGPVANAEEIVRRVNAHDELLKALKSLVSAEERDLPDIEIAWNNAKRAIAKAEGRMS